MRTKKWIRLKLKSAMPEKNGCHCLIRSHGSHFHSITQGKKFSLMKQTVRKTLIKITLN